MHGAIPEITPRLTKDDTANGPHLGTCFEFGPKLKYLLAQGAYGEAKTQRSLAGLMYVPQDWLKSALNDEQETRVKSAYRRLENLSKPSDKSLLQRELDFLRAGFNRLFGDNAVGMISDQELLSYSLKSLVSRLMGTEVTLNLDLVDPVLAIEAMATTNTDEIDIEFDFVQPRRWFRQEGGVELADEKVPIERIKLHEEFRLCISGSMVKSKPLILQFVDHERSTKDGDKARAQALYKAVKEDDDCPWRVAKPLNRPLAHESGEGGNFGLMVLANSGCDLAELLPEGANPLALTDQDLRHLTEKLIDQLARSTPPVIAIKRYEVIKPSAR